MVNDGDIAAALPDPPPPAPARREAAIEAALRRFDGADAKDASPSRDAAPRSLPWWRQLGRPQIGAMVSAALVALVGVPAVWMSIENRQIAYTPGAPADRTARPGPGQTQTAPQPESAASSTAAPDAGHPAPPQAPATAPLPQPAIALAEAGIPAPAPPPPPPSELAPPAQADMAVQDITVSASRRSETPPAPPSAFQDKAAAPRLAAEARADTEDAGIVVTGARIQRRSDRRGDWNACTVDDPARNLSGCKRFFDPDAKGKAGRAGAHIADGLNSAWEGDDEAAVTAFDKAIAAAPRNGFAYLNRGLAHQRQGELDRAIADLDQAIRHDPGAARNYYVRSQLHRQRGDTRRARIDAEHAVDIDPRYADLVR
ncbi:tetratricopeptide repeat protein [Sphingomonas colocasiae]|uniref:Tetratricopeptide repeat protein n=1 Tax=Sphingomonas colocasiae TaxID=1848973 RepID=A0ABS7Q209_9SPHN|nr:tetratricopeptide repeat protein [Sphingomonas colocasiae]MBY8826274.1 tetratricopeptide repeat protein [Sphingomonas colocasiae]